jgi:hypothetical protein
VWSLPWFDYAVQPDLLQLLSAETKRDAEKFARDMVIKAESLAGLILHHARFGYSHRRKHFDHVPDARKPMPGELDAVFGDDDEARRSAIGKISAIFEERKLVSAHLFEKDRQWHIFYFSQRDYRGLHGAMGPHVHYVSHLLLPQTSAGNVWQELDKRIYSIGSDLHIKISDEKPDKDGMLRRHRNRLKRDRRERRR